MPTPWPRASADTARPSVEPAGVALGVKHLMGWGSQGQLLCTAGWSAHAVNPCPAERRTLDTLLVEARGHGVLPVPLAEARARVACTMEFGRNEAQ